MNPLYILTAVSAIIAILGCAENGSTDKASNQTQVDFILREDFKTYFDSCGVEGSIVIYDYEDATWMASDTLGIHMETLPASTFKIINLLTALETKTIVDENEVVKWPGITDTVKYGYRPDIYRDMSVREAFELSAGWVFIELSKKIGPENYQKYLADSKYGNLDLSQQDADFWNFGNFGISPKNQVEFLISLYDGQLPFSARNMDIVKNVMITEQTEKYTIRAKTGWTRENDINTGWWTGYIETQKGTYIFSTRLLQDRKNNRPDFGSCRKEITKKIFKNLGIIEG